MMFSLMIILGENGNDYSIYSKLMWFRWWCKISLDAHWCGDDASTMHSIVIYSSCGKKSRWQSTRLGMHWGWNTVRRISRSLHIYYHKVTQVSCCSALLWFSEDRCCQSIPQVMFPSYRGYMASVELGSEDIRKVWYLYPCFEPHFQFSVFRCKVCTASQEELLWGEKG